jgi:hypothetical protein
MATLARPNLLFMLRNSQARFRRSWVGSFVQAVTERKLARAQAIGYLPRHENSARFFNKTNMFPLANAVRPALQFRSQCRDSISPRFSYN